MKYSEILLELKSKKVLKESSKSVTIEKSQGEYRVPAEDGYEDGSYYTNDKEDAIGTCKKIYGKDVVIKFRSVPEFVGGKYEKMKPKGKKKNLKESKEVYDCENCGESFTTPRPLVGFVAKLCPACGGEEYGEHGVAQAEWEREQRRDR